MVIINAEWEKRNFGVDTYEVQFEEKDKIADLEESFENIEADYIVAKVPSVRSDISDYVQNKGYHYMEDLIHVEHDLHEIKRNILHQRLYDATSYRKMTEEDVHVLIEEIRAGMFDTDRISRDEMFGKEIAATRYLNWIKDMLQEGAYPYVVLYKEEAAGFIILQTKDKIHYESVLGGGYQKYRNSGLGIVQKEQEIVKKLGGRKVSTCVSSNNPSQVRALIINGYVTKEIEHVFTKHNERSLLYGKERNY